MIALIIAPDCIASAKKCCSVYLRLSFISTIADCRIKERNRLPIDLAAIKSPVGPNTELLLVQTPMSCGNRNNFYFPGWLNGCQGYLLDIEPHASLTV